MNWRRAASVPLGCCLLLSVLRAAASQSCSAVGSLHFMTFDGKAVDFPYACKYVMAKTCSRLAPVGFEIRVKTAAYGPEGRGPVGIQYVEVAAEGKTVRLSPDGSVHVDGALVSAYDYKCRLKAQRAPLGTELSILTANVSVTVSERGLVLVRIPESLKTFVCGLCGNFDGNGNNDYTTDTAREWFLPDPTDRNCATGPVTSPGAALYSTQDGSNAALCYKMISKFETCNQMNPLLLNNFEDFCLQDVLASGCSDLVGSACGPELSEDCDCGPTVLSDVTCRLGEALATQFALLGCTASQWPGQDFSECRQNCSHGSRYSENVSSCTRACSAKDGSGCGARAVSCIKPLWTDGCVCPEGQLWSGSSCVTESNCACTFGTGLLYPVGSKWLDSTCSAEIECLPMSQLNYTMMQCADNSDCVLQKDQWQCRCREGYTGDGRVSCKLVCGPGTKKTESYDSCESCPVGSYQPEHTTATSCTECPDGKLTNAPGSVSDSDCVAMEIIPADERSYVACQNFDCVKQVFVPVDILADGIPVGSANYRSLWVSSNAILSFDGSFLGRQTRNLLEESTAVIAPFWLRMDFRARGSSITIGEYSQQAGREKLQIVKKIFEPLPQYSTPTSNYFVPLWAVIATWTAAMPFPHQASGTSENITVQLVLASDGWTTKTAFIYPAGRQHLTSPKVLRGAEMGFNLKNDLAFRFFGSGTPLMGQLDSIESNTGIKGRWIFDIAQQTRKLAEQKACLDWYSQQAGIWNSRKPSAISCPCDWRTALEDPNYQTDHVKKCAISLFRSSVHGFYQMCCYDPTNTWSARLLIDAGSESRPIQYNPNFETERTKHLIYDQKPFLDCCIRTQNCHLYRQYRPADNCVAYRPPTSGGGGGDPHFKTLDGLDYTYNAIGEFHLLKSSRMSVQTRLGRFGSSDATEFKAIACQSLQPPSSRIHVELNSNGNGLLIMVKPPGFGVEANETTRFSNEQQTVRNYIAVTLMGNTVQLKILFENGYGISVGVADGMIQQSIFVPQSDKRNVSGLLGDYDGNPLNDLTVLNGVSKDCATNTNKSRCINDIFGPAWRISGNESIFWYRDQLSTIAYTDYTFKPLLFDSSNIASRIVGVCGSSEQCQYDLLATNSSKIALSTKNFVQSLNARRETLGATRPVMQTVSEIRARVGDPVSLRIDVASSSPIVNIRSLKAPPTATLTKHNGSTFIFNWLPEKNTDVRNHLPLRFIATDGEKDSSSTVTIKIAFCECNVTGGTCVWPETFGEFASVACNCSDGWIGARCSEDYNACNGNPCGAGGVCFDMLPGATEEYECKCNSGYLLAGEPPTCQDFDECANKTVTCGANELCTNTPGNYSCDCASGFSRNAPNVRCEDIDECKSAQHNQCEHICNNYIGGYNCSCFAGFKLNGTFQCVKAAVSVPNCDQLRCPQACIVNSAGQAQCACQRGFKIADNGLCVDVNECEELPCGNNSACVNTPGSFSCTCDVGFHHYNSRVNCEKCPAGTYGTDCNLTCSCGARARYCDHVTGCTGCTDGWTGAQCSDDIDECQNMIACPGFGLMCNNTKGSYICECARGYQLSANGQECVDIDECASMNDPCPHGFECQNVPGSHTCTVCLDGFEKRDDYCLDVDECLLNGTCSSNAECENTLGSYECRCARGFYGDGFPESRGSGCVDVDECSATPWPCPPESTCVNTQGSFTCICNEGRVALSDCCILLSATDDCRQQSGFQNSTACCLLGGGISCVRSGEALPAGAQCQPWSPILSSTSTIISESTRTTPSAGDTSPSGSVTPSIGDTSESSSATPSVGVFTIFMNHLLQIDLPDIDEAIAMQHLQKALEKIYDRIQGFPPVQNFTASLEKPQNASNVARKRSIADKSVYNVSYSVTFLGAREKVEEIVFSVAAAIIEAGLVVKSYANATVYFVSPLFFATDETPMIEASCQSLKACPGYCQSVSQLLPKCICPNGVNSYKCTAATTKPETPEEESEYLPLWITAGVLGGILALALVTAVIVIIVRRHRREVNLHRQDPSRRPNRDERSAFGEYFDGIFRPVRRPSIHRRSRSESTSTASSNSTESYHSSAEGRVGRTVPFGPRWPKAYKSSARSGMFSPANDNEDDQ